jgi:hypothetical protein
MTDQTTIERLIAYTNLQYGWACTPDDLVKHRESDGVHVLLLDRGINGTPKVLINDADVPDEIDDPGTILEDGVDVSLGGLFKSEAERAAEQKPDETDLSIEQQEAELQEMTAVADFRQAGLTAAQELALHKAGYATFYDLDQASAKELTAVGGIGKGAVGKIRDYCSGKDLGE